MSATGTVLLAAFGGALLGAAGGLVVAVLIVLPMLKRAVPLDQMRRVNKAVDDPYDQVPETGDIHIGVARLGGQRRAYRQK